MSFNQSYLWAERNEGSDELVANQVGMIGKPVGTVRPIFARFAANLVDRRFVRRQVRAHHETLSGRKKDWNEEIKIGMIERRGDRENTEVERENTEVERENTEVERENTEMERENKG